MKLEITKIEDTKPEGGGVIANFTDTKGRKQNTVDAVLQQISTLCSSKDGNSRLKKNEIVWRHWIRILKTIHKESGDLCGFTDEFCLACQQALTAMLYKFFWEIGEKEILLSHTSQSLQEGTTTLTATPDKTFQCNFATLLDTGAKVFEKVLANHV